jgi:predicted protein tyrosine phosphatase
MRPELVVLSLASASRFVPGQNDVCISIRTPGAPEAELRTGWRAVLREWFNDLPQNQPRAVAGDITPAQADRIVRFALTHQGAARIVIHCEAGASRSPSVAMALADPTSPGPAPNPTVFAAVAASMVRLCGVAA